MTFDAAIIPKNARIASLERSLAEKIDLLHEVQQQKAAFISQLTDAERQISELDLKLTSAQTSLQEKDSVIQMMQKSFLEPEEEEPSTTPPQNYQGSQKSPDIPPCLVTEVSPSSVLLPCSTRSPATNPQCSVASSTPQNQARQSSLGSPLHHLSNHTGQSSSPIKSLGSNVLRPRVVTTSFLLKEPPAHNRRNGTTHALSSGGRYSSSSPHHHSSNNVLSSAAPNSPSVRNTPHKSRITHSNLRALQVSATTERPDPIYRQKNMYAKSNAGGMRRSNYQRPPSPRLVKSKTPPPDYHLVSSGRTKSSSPKTLAKNPRHKSVDDILQMESESSKLHLHSGHSAMQDKSCKQFRSLVGDSVPMSQSRGGGGGGGGVHNKFSFISSVQVGMPESNDCHDHHQHSKSSPSNNCIMTSS